jgi:hypothetical protein
MWGKIVLQIDELFKFIGWPHAWSKVITDGIFINPPLEKIVD